MDDECGPAIGIDLGTTYSCVGIWRNGSVEIIVNGQGNRTTPSYVAFTDKGRLIGEGAKNQAAMNPLHTIFDAKRLIGRRFSEESVQSDMRLWPFKVIAGLQDNPMIVVRYKDEEKQFAPEEISSMILSQMRGIAEVYLGKMVKEAVITVPAYFNDLQRCATKDAGTIAGLNVMRIINEPTAAALAYGINMKANGITSKRNVLIFDLGGGTFDVSALEIEDGVFEVKATNGDTHLGGEDFDNRMVDYLVEMFRRKHDKDVRTSPRALRRLRTACERAKRFLSFATEATVEVDSLFDGVDFHTSISRARFEDINMDLFMKCMGLVKQCLEDAKIDKCMIDDVVIVGGSTRIPRVQTLLQEFFEGKPLSNSINADEAVAYGAAVQAAMLSANTSQAVQELVLLDVTPLSLGIETTGGIMSTVVPRNTHIPCKMERIFWNPDHKIAVDISVYEGERSMVMSNNLLGRFTLLGVLKKPGSTVKIPVTFQIDSNGILSVSATSEGSSDKGSITITNDTRSLAKEEIERMIRDAKRYKYEDEQRKIIADAKNELETFVCSIKNIMRDVAITRKLRYEEMHQIEIAISEALNWLVSESSTAGLHQIQYRKTEMEDVWSPIKARLQL